MSSSISLSSLFKQFYCIVISRQENINEADLKCVYKPIGKYQKEIHSFYSFVLCTISKNISPSGRYKRLDSAIQTNNDSKWRTIQSNPHHRSSKIPMIAANLRCLVQTTHRHKIVPHCGCITTFIAENVLWFLSYSKYDASY